MSERRIKSLKASVDVPATEFKVVGSIRNSTFAGMWNEALLSGISLGLVLALLIGPVFFLLIDTGITRGFRAASFIAVGVVASDAFFVLIAYFSSRAIRFISLHQMAIGLTGGAILIGFGIATLFRKPVISGQQLEVNGRVSHELNGIWKGFIMNFLNPFVLIFWMGVAGSLVAGGEKDPRFAVTFFTAALVTVFTTDLLKAWGAARLKRLIRPVYLLWLNRISGVGLVAFGVRLILKLM